jgi:hypothetical protein
MVASGALLEVGGSVSGHSGTPSEPSREVVLRTWELPEGTILSIEPIIEIAKVLDGSNLRVELLIRPVAFRVRPSVSVFERRLRPSASIRTRELKHTAVVRKRTQKHDDK